MTTVKKRRKQPITQRFESVCFAHRNLRANASRPTRKHTHTHRGETETDKLENMDAFLKASIAATKACFLFVD